jgi:hypothetical protein
MDEAKTVLIIDGGGVTYGSSLNISRNWSRHGIARLSQVLRAKWFLNRKKVHRLEPGGIAVSEKTGRTRKKQCRISICIITKQPRYAAGRVACDEGRQTGLCERSQRRSYLSQQATPRHTVHLGTPHFPPQHCPVATQPRNMQAPFRLHTATQLT